MRICFLVPVIWFLSISSGQSLAETACNHKAEPWLDNACQMPDVKNPNHACRYAQYMKAKKIDPYDPTLKHYKDQIFKFDWPESWEQIAFETCEAVKTGRCAEIVGTLYERLNLIAGEAITNYKMDLPVFVATPQSTEVDLNIIRSFDYLATQNRDILLLIEKTVADTQAISAGLSSYEQLKTAEKSLHDKFELLRARTLEQSQREMLLIDRMDTLVASIGTNGLAALIGSAGYGCDLTGSFSTSKHNELVERIVDSVNRVKQEIRLSARQRGDLIRVAYAKGRYLTYHAYADKAGQKIDELLGQLNKDLWLSRMLWDFADWWSSISVNGLAGNLHTRFYMYSDPLRILRSEKGIAISYKDRIRNNPLFVPATGDVALKSIDEKIALIDKAISFIETRGWKGLLSLQQAAATKRASLLPGNTVCATAVKLFLQGAAKVNDVKSFDDNSGLYRKSVSACQK